MSYEDKIKVVEDNKDVCLFSMFSLLIIVIALFSAGGFFYMALISL